MPLVAVTVTLGSIVALLLAWTQLTLIAAATPTLPPPAPDWPEAELLAEFVWLPALGRGGVLLVFGLPATWPFAWLSAVPLLSEVPLALAFVLAPLLTSDSAETSTAVPVTPRPSSALVPQVMTTLTEMSAPTATPDPAASAEPSVSAASIAWWAAIVIAPEETSGVEE